MRRSSKKRPVLPSWTLRQQPARQVQPNGKLSPQRQGQMTYRTLGADSAAPSKPVSARRRRVLRLPSAAIMLGKPLARFERVAG